MPLTDSEMGPDDRYNEWVRILERIRQEHVGLAWSHYVFRLLREVFNANEQLRRKGGFILNAVAEMYVTHALMVFRRDMDRQHGTENVINLLYDLKTHANLLTRARSLSTWNDTNEALLRLGNSQFEAWSPIRGARGPGSDYIDPATIQRDIDLLNERVERVREYAERTRAHRSPELDPEVTVTFGEMHEAIRELRKTINRYSVLLTGSPMAQWEPVPQYDMLEPFLAAWLPDDPAVLRAIREAVERDSVDDA